jgi:hypothetical protein
MVALLCPLLDGRLKQCLARIVLAEKADPGDQANIEHARLPNDEVDPGTSNIYRGAQESNLSFVELLQLLELIRRPHCLLLVACASPCH